MRCCDARFTAQACFAVDGGMNVKQKPFETVLSIDSACIFFRKARQNHYPDRQRQRSVRKPRRFGKRAFERKEALSDARGVYFLARLAGKSTHGELVRTVAVVFHRAHHGSIVLRWQKIDTQAFLPNDIPVCVTAFSQSAEHSVIAVFPANERAPRLRADVRHAAVLVSRYDEQRLRDSADEFQMRKHVELPGPAGLKVRRTSRTDYDFHDEPPFLLQNLVKVQYSIIAVLRPKRRVPQDAYAGKVKISRFCSETFY